MTTRTFRRLRQAELVKWLLVRFGRSWRMKLAVDMGIPVIRTYRWFKDDISGTIQEEIEIYAYRNGFVSIYDEALAGYYGHQIVLDEIMKRATARIEKIGRGKTLKGAAFPLDQDELDQLLAGLNYKLATQR